MGAAEKTIELKTQLAKLLEQAKALEEQIESTSAEELKTDVNGFVAKMTAKGFTVEALITELRTHSKAASTAAKKTRAARGSVVKEEKPYEMGVKYKNPKGDEVWVGGTKGRQPPWLRDLMPESWTAAEKQAKFKALAVK